MLQTRSRARTPIQKKSRDLIQLAANPSQMHTGLILERLYRVRQDRVSLRARVVRARRALFGWIGERSWGFSIGSLVFAGWVLSHVYFYNRLVLLESNVECTKAQIDAVELKRHHIQSNLIRLLRYYAKYERTVISEATTMRTKHGPKPLAALEPGDSESLSDLLARLNAVAEQYPTLDLGKNVQQMSESIMNTEDEIAKRIMAYDEAVNAYRNMLSTFPGNIFGRVMGFDDHSFYEPDDRSVLKYREVQP